MPRIGVGSGVAIGKGVGLPQWAVGTDIAWDFAAGVNYNSAPNPTDSHASTIYVKDSSGLYVPKTTNVLCRTDLGLETVPTAQNLIVNSDDWGSADWFGPQLTVSSDLVPSPLFGRLADGLIASAASNTKSRGQGIALAANTRVTVRVLLKMNHANGRFAFVNVLDTATFTNLFGCAFDLQTGTLSGSPYVAGNGVVSFATITPVGNGFYECVVSGIPSTTATGAFPSVELNPSSVSGNWTGDGTTVIGYVGNATLQTGTFASQPILSSGAGVQATVNGNQQTVSIATAKLNSGVAGIVQVDQRAPTPSPAGHLLEFSDGSDNNKVEIEKDGSNFFMQALAATVTQAFITPAGYATGIKTLAFAAAPNYFNIRVVGSADPGADTSGTVPAGMDRLTIGGQWWNGDQNFQSLRKLALKFGPQDASSFAALFAKAQLA